MNFQKIIPDIPQTETDAFSALMALARFLRSPEGCPWDRKQTTNSFAAFILEEAGELCEALESKPEAMAEEEWGDTFFTILACMAAAEEEGKFTLARALQRAHEKMVRRHAHIFGDHVAETPEEVMQVWQAIKAQEQAERDSEKDPEA